MATSGETKSSRSRQAVKHSKTFSGCWTCRARHLKCDEGRPTCQRCQKGGVKCQGYDVKLVWTNSEGHAKQQNIRRLVDIESYFQPQPLSGSVKVDKILKLLDQSEEDVEERISGPFSVFSLTSKSDGEHEAERPLAGQSENQRSPKDDCQDELDEDIELIDRSWDVENVDNSLVPAFSNTSLTMAEVEGWIQSSDDQLFIQIPQASQILRHIDLLPRPAEQKELVHHWVTHICWHLVPVDAEENPFRSVFTPLAMAGLLSPSRQSSGQIALFHALCATAAFSRGQLLNHDFKSLTLAMKHYQLAITHLRHSLLKENASQRESILATITMFSAMDMITGRSSEWRTHLEGGASWLATMGNQPWDLDRSSAVIYQGYLAIAALCNIDLPSTINLESEEWLDSKYYCLDRFFGLTQTTLKHIMMMNSLVKQVSTATPRELDLLEVQISLQTPDSLDLTGLDEQTALLTRHHASVFYYASLIYFKRTVRHVHPDSLHQMVETAIDHLEAIELLGRDMIGCTLVWPPFVVACECLTQDQQDRILAWYALKRRHGFMNLQNSKDIACEVWRRRDVEGSDIDVRWQDVLKDLKMDIVLA